MLAIVIADVRRVFLAEVALRSFQVTDSAEEV